MSDRENDASGISVERALSERIRELRIRANLAQGDLAARIGRTQATLSLWENGRRTPGVNDLAALAAALNVTIPDFFERSDAEDAPPPRRAVLRHAGLVLREALIADVELFADAAERQRRPAATLDIDANGPEDAATTILSQLAIHEAPVRLGPIAKACGLRVLGWDFDDEVSGLLLDLSSGPVVGFNRNHARTRRRFTVAHEVGHWLLGHLKDFHVDLSISTADIGEPPGFKWKNERDANRFAAELLMPAPMLKDAYRDDQDISSLARMFMVSPQAMGFRVGNVGLGG